MHVYCTKKPRKLFLCVHSILRNKTNYTEKTYNHSLILCGVFLIPRGQTHLSFTEFIDSTVKNYIGSYIFVSFD